MSEGIVEYISATWVLRFPTDILTTILTQWLSLVEISLLDQCISQIQVRKKFLDIISGDSVSYGSPSPHSISNVHYYRWLYFRNISVQSIRTSYNMDVKLQVFLQEKVCRHIRRLDFSCGASHDILNLPLLLSYCPKLEQLLLCENLPKNVVDGDAFSAIVRYSPYLRVLELHNNLELCDTKMLQLVTGCRKLSELHFHYCYGVDNAALTHVANHCKGLQKLTVRTNEGITGEGIRVVAQHCVQLTQLVLPACLRITSESVSMFSQYCANLQHLNLSVLTIRDPALHSIAKHCVALVSLILTRCSFITNQGVLEVIEGCKQLQLLDVRYCHHLTLDFVHIMENSTYSVQTILFGFNM